MHSVKGFQYVDDLPSKRRVYIYISYVYGKILHLNKQNLMLNVYYFI